MTVKTNADQVSRELAELARRLVNAAGAAVYAAGNVVMTEAKQRTPVDTGAMRSSGYVSIPQTRGGDVEVEVGFGGPSKDYVVAQHERTEYRHDVGEAKFLQNAINAKEGEARRVAVRAYEQAMRGAMPDIDRIHPTRPDGGGQ